MDESLPDGFSAYKQTPVFDEVTVPAGLLRGHSTKAGVWGVIHILDGKLVYRTLEPLTERVVDKDSPRIVIKPQELHEVAINGPVLFYVEFHAARKPDL